MYYMKSTMQFKVLDEDVNIDPQGDVFTPYDIINWQMNGTDEIAFVRVGTYNAISKDSDEFSVNNDTIYWNTPTNTVSELLLRPCL